ncbi:hypothetical protein GCM10009677_62090 [Sphaerisporangium rubeum]|uniref:Transcriptional regulator with XRE-family HTH domain n=1 Tax=Sphaerisporangium rubeum TaxID=321317 RepID=A0A7X0M4A9_9ACTN|nr:transcriptional regulator with XRE-family HTH domain [Sphaerisporangium rubeum]
MSEQPSVEDLAAYLRHLKNKTGRSYDALAKRLGVGKSTLHRYCSGDSVPPRFTLLEQFAKECQATRPELVELHRLWVQAQTTAEPSAQEPGDEQPVETPPPAPPAPEKAAPRRRLSLPSTPRTWGALATSAAVVIAAVLIWRPGPDPRADADTAHCTGRTGVRHVDERQAGHVWTRDFVCVNRTDTPLYADVSGTARIATLDTPKSWFVCWDLGRVQADGGRVWYYTRGDRSEPLQERWEGWGFVAAEHVTATTHPIPDMPRCTGLR